MAFTTPRTWTYGETVTEAQFNEQLRDNFNAIWVGTTAGDIDYYTSNTTKARLAGGTANASICLRMDSAGTSPEYGGVVSYRQGGTATNWDTHGTVNYETSKTIMQAGVLRVSWSGYTAYGTINFPHRYSYIPILVYGFYAVQGYPLANPITIQTDTNSATACIFKLSSGNSSNAIVNVSWISVGQA